MHRKPLSKLGNNQSLNTRVKRFYMFFITLFTYVIYRTVDWPATDRGGMA